MRVVSVSDVCIAVSRLFADGYGRLIKSAVSDSGEDQGAEEEAFMGCTPREDRFRQFWKSSPV